MDLTKSTQLVTVITIYFMGTLTFPFGYYKHCGETNIPCSGYTNSNAMRYSKILKVLLKLI